MSTPETDTSKCKSPDSEDASKGVKRPAEVKVHTANDWEHAHLDGGDERKLKFLRLMGASKKDQSGPIKIGERESQKQHGRSEKEEVELETKLEKQFETNLEYKLKGGARRHKGLGFEEEEIEKETQDSVPKEIQGDKEASEIPNKEESSSTPLETHPTPAEAESQPEKKDSEEAKTSIETKKFLMSFVKGSS